MSLTDKRKYDDLSPNSSPASVIKATKIGESDILRAMERMNNELKASIDGLRSDLSAFLAEKIVMAKEIDELKAEREKDRRTMLSLEDQLKRNNLIFRGIPTETSINQAVEKVCSGNMKIVAPMAIRSCRKLFDRNGKMAVIVEFENESYIREIFKNTKNLAGSSISVERDLNSERQEKKKVMLKLMKDLKSVSQTHKIGVRDDKLRINEKWFTWNRNNQLMCGSANGEEVIRGLFRENLNNINFEYKSILGKVNYVKN